LFARALVSAMTSFDLRGRFGAFVSARKIPFPGNRDFGSKRRSSKGVISEEEGRAESSQKAKRGRRPVGAHREFAAVTQRPTTRRAIAVGFAIYPHRANLIGATACGQNPLSWQQWVLRGRFTSAGHLRLGRFSFFRSQKRDALALDHCRRIWPS
jgi:hypothetical protein